MAEEINNAAIVIPRAIMLSVLINGVLGFGMLIAVLFCVGNIDDALKSPTGYPFIEIFYQATESTAGTVLMCTILLIIGIFGVIGILAAASRQIWSFARDRAVPGWRLWIYVCPFLSMEYVQAELTKLFPSGFRIHAAPGLRNPPDTVHHLASGTHQHRLQYSTRRYSFHGSVRYLLVVSCCGLLTSLSAM